MEDDLTKTGKEILCTVGPASMNDYVLSRLNDIGVSLLRINLSHTKVKELEGMIDFIRRRTSIPICLDTEGAQVRTGPLYFPEVYLPENSVVIAGRNRTGSNGTGITLYPDDVIELLAVGDMLSIDFNSVIAQIVEKTGNGVHLRILTGGAVRPNKAVTLLNRDLPLSALTRKDRDALHLGRALGVRHVALSFASEPSDIDLVRSLGEEPVWVIAKIESFQGLENLEGIAQAADGLLVDRGDLSRQVPLESIPVAQKHIIETARRFGRKVYVATNLLESMVTAPTPTRAEISDIFTTLGDGADGLVLAAETAIGQYPVQCALMVSKMIRYYCDPGSRGFSLAEVRNRKSQLLTEPLGGTLIRRQLQEFDREEVNGFPSIAVDRTALLDAEQVAIGTFSPLEGFVREEELISILEHCRLPQGIPWTLPIMLQVPAERASKLRRGETLALRLADEPEPYALLHVEDIYSYDLDRLCSGLFLTNDLSHPGVRALKEKGKWFLGGKIDLLKRLPSKHKSYELTPREVRKIFESKGWSKVVSFHTRNVIHRAHEHIQLQALNHYCCDGLFIHPIVGPKKNGDYVPEVILRSYELMMENEYYPRGKTFLAAFQNYSRYCGPREAVFTALCRKNFGCSHFIVGRDHTGLGNYYPPDGARKLFEELGDLGITPLFFDEYHYCGKCRTYVDRCRHGQEAFADISGTHGRQMLLGGKKPPEWFMREEVSNFLLDQLASGREVFIK